MDLRETSVDRGNSGGRTGAVAGGRTPYLAGWCPGRLCHRDPARHLWSTAADDSCDVIVYLAGTSGAWVWPRSEIEAGCIASFLFLTLQQSKLRHACKNKDTVIKLMRSVRYRCVLLKDVPKAPWTECYTFINKK